MKNRILNLSLAALVLCLALPALGQEQPSQEEMAAMMKAAMPGPHHAELMKSVGNWEMSSKMYMTPGAPPVETNGTSTIEGLLDGRFVMETIQAPMMGMPWTGHGIYGYDNTTQKHVGTWFDATGTGMLFFEGTCEKSCSVVTMTASFMDPMSKSMKKMKSISKKVDDDTMAGEIYDVAKDGKETKTMEMTYKRKK